MRVGFLSWVFKVCEYFRDQSSVIRSSLPYIVVSSSRQRHHEEEEEEEELDLRLRKLSIEEEEEGEEDDVFTFYHS